MVEEKKNKIFTPIFIASASVSAIIAIASLVSPDLLAAGLTSGQQVLSVVYGWFAMLIPFLCMMLLLALGLPSKYSHIVIGGQDAKPDYSMFSWLAMLFSASIGMGIIYFAVNEPLFAFALSPGSTEAPSVMEAARHAMGTTLQHWGVSVWAIFSVSGLVFSYFVFKYKTKYLPGDIIHRAWSKRGWSKATANLVNVTACVCSAMTIAATLGLGSVQLATGITNIFGLDPAWRSVLPYIMLGILVLMGLPAATTKKVGNGMRILGGWNAYICIGVMVYAIVVGPTRYIFEQMVHTTGRYFAEIIPRNFDMFIFSADPIYSHTWTVANNMWWLSWTPFMAVFIASISKGRTIRQFSFATMFIPAAFLLIWHSTFGATALLNLIQGDGSIAAHALESPDMTFFAILETLPLTQFITIASVILLLFFLATSITSGALALGRMTDIEGKNPAPARCAVWALIMSGIALTGIFAAQIGGEGALIAIRSLATTMAYPYMFVFILLTTAFLRQLKRDEERNPTPNPKVASGAELLALRERIAALEAATSHRKNEADGPESEG